METDSSSASMKRGKSKQRMTRVQRLVRFLSFNQRNGDLDENRYRPNEYAMKIKIWRRKISEIEKNRK